jgi:hypothetical protein
MQPCMVQTPHPQPLAIDFQDTQESHVGGSLPDTAGLVRAAESEVGCGAAFHCLPSNLGLGDQRRTIPPRYGLDQTVWAQVGAIEVHLCGLLIKPGLRDSSAAVELIPYLRYARAVSRGVGPAGR